jgi:hypothetical protein
MPRGALLFWVLVSILLSVALTVVLNLLLLFKSFEKLLPSGAGHCIAVRRKVFQESRGFDPDLKFDGIELIRRLSKVRRFCIVAQQVYVSDRRYREHGVSQMFLTYLLMALFFALGKHRWANHLTYEFGRHEP